jgi:hypothetical protein
VGTRERARAGVEERTHVRTQLARASAGSDAHSRQGEEKEGDKNERRGGGRAVGVPCETAGGWLNAKTPRNRNFVFLVVEYFGTRGVLRKKNESSYCSGGTSLDAEQNNGEIEVLFCKIPRDAGGFHAARSARSEGRENGAM